MQRFLCPRSAGWSSGLLPRPRSWACGRCPPASSRGRPLCGRGLISSSCEDPSRMGQGQPSDPIYLSHLCKDPISKHTPLLGLGERTSPVNFGGWLSAPVAGQAKGQALVWTLLPGGMRGTRRHSRPFRPWARCRLPPGKGNHSRSRPAEGRGPHSHAATPAGIVFLSIFAKICQTQKGIHPSVVWVCLSLIAAEFEHLFMSIGHLGK